MGELSYTMYLGHLLVVDLYAGFDFGWAHWGRFPVLVMALTIALAWLIRQAVEKPADRWRARLTHRWLGVSG